MAGPQVVVVTGTSAGVGRATALAFAEEGALLGLLARGLEGAGGDQEGGGGGGEPRSRDAHRRRRPRCRGPLSNGTKVARNASTNEAQPRARRSAAAGLEFELLRGDDDAAFLEGLDRFGQVGEKQRRLVRRLPDERRNMTTEGWVATVWARMVPKSVSAEMSTRSSSRARSSTSWSRARCIPRSRAWTTS